jgi:hypothetical protein
MLIGGRMTTPGGDIRQQGIAYGTDLRSAAIATGWSGSAYALSFSISANTYVTAYADSFGVSDVVNSSYSYSDASGTGVFTLFGDAVAWLNSRTTHVVSAGNSGPGANTVGAPGSGYNSLTVAALRGANEYDAVASFSSRGPQDFGYYDADLGLLTVAGVRAAVDLAAPGTQLVSAFYGGQTGGNNTSLAGSANAGSVPNAYSSGINGTSFAAPIVAGGAALVASAAKTLPGLAANPSASESMVVKALLLTGADKTAGWSNGQNLVNEGGDDFLRTTQSLDWDVGAGRMNLDRTFDIQVSGQQDVAGFALGAMGAVASLGWDYGAARFGTDNDYILDGFFPANSSLGTTLAWLRVRDWDAGTGDLFEVAQADLNLSVWALDGSNAFDTLVAESVSAYNVVEHLSFVLPSAGRYGLRVSYGANTFDNTVGDIWGTPGFEQAYGLAWMVVVPEPAAWLLLGVAGLACLVTRRRRS